MTNGVCGCLEDCRAAGLGAVCGELEAACVVDIKGLSEEKVELAPISTAAAAAAATRRTNKVGLFNCMHREIALFLF